jgi:hypothetical protein
MSRASTTIHTQQTAGNTTSTVRSEADRGRTETCGL